MFMSENTCALVDLFDKAVSCQEGARPNTVKTRSQPTTRHRNVDLML